MKTRISLRYFVNHFRLSNCGLKSESEESAESAESAKSAKSAQSVKFAESTKSVAFT